MSTGHEPAPGGQPVPVGWGGPAREEQAEVETLRDEADRAAEEAARTIAELTGRLSPRNLTERLSPRNLTQRLVPRHVAARLSPARLSGNRTLKLAATVLPVAAALAAAAVAVAAAARRRSDALAVPWPKGRRAAGSGKPWRR